MPKSLIDFDQTKIEMDELRSQVRRTRTELAKAKAKSVDLVAAVYQASKDAAVILGPVPPVVPYKTITRGRKDKDEVALLHTSDWQLGKLTETYNMRVCEERLELLADKVNLLTEIQRSAHPVSRVHVMFGGDIVEGVDIFPGQAYEIEESLYGQLFTAVRLGVQLVRRLKSMFDVVEVTGEPGNHGRLGRKGQFPARDNSDRMAYKIMSQAFLGDKQVIWHEDSGGWHQIVQIGTYRALLIHGDEIKSFGGNIPAFGLLRKGTAWSSGVVPGGFQDIYYGHFHTPMELTLPNGGVMYGVGSTESDNAYAAEFVAARGLPSQRLHFIDPRKGRVTAQYKIILDEA